MYTSNPYAQGGWRNPQNPLSVYQAGGSDFQPQPSVYGALPSLAVPAVSSPDATPRTLVFRFIELNPTVANSIVVGPKNQHYFTISTVIPSASLVFTTFHNIEGKTVARIEWSQTPVVEIGSQVPRQPAPEWLRCDSNGPHRVMYLNQRWHTWCRRDREILLLTVNAGKTEMLARIVPKGNDIELEITEGAAQMGYLAVTVVATVLFYSGIWN